MRRRQTAATEGDETAATPARKEEQDSSVLRWFVLLLLPALGLALVYSLAHLQKQGQLEQCFSFLKAGWGSVTETVASLMGQHGTLFSAERMEEDAAKGTLLLVLVGHVFDVTSGAKHYGPGQSYSGFVGRDASRAFVSGDFTPAGLTDDLEGLKPRECLALQDWLDFYQKDPKYPQVGLLEGRFWGDKGGRRATPLEPLQRFKDCAKEGQREAERSKEALKQYPKCNSRWSSEEGGFVWCTTPEEDKEGGKSVERVPRLLPPDLVGGGSESKKRCTCVTGGFATSHPEFGVYDGCDPQATRCMTKPPGV